MVNVHQGHLALVASARQGLGCFVGPVCLGAFQLEHVMAGEIPQDTLQQNRVCLRCLLKLIEGDISVCVGDLAKDVKVLGDLCEDAVEWL